MTGTQIEVVDNIPYDEYVNTFPQGTPPHIVEDLGIDMFKSLETYGCMYSRLMINGIGVRADMNRQTFKASIPLGRTSTSPKSPQRTKSGLDGLTFLNTRTKGSKRCRDSSEETVTRYDR